MIFLVFIFILLAIVCFWQFLQQKFSPLWLMLSAWCLAIGLSQLYLSNLELIWSNKYWALVLVSLLSFSLGVFAFNKIWKIRSGQGSIDVQKLRWVIYGLVAISIGTLYLFYKRAGNFPLFAQDPDSFRFIADNQVPGLINYCAQLARIFIPLSFFVMFYEMFSWKKHWDLVLVSIFGIISIILFTSRTQIFFVDLWVMGLYLLMRRPNLKQALKFYPVFLLVSVLVLAAVPIYRQYKSYGADYLSSVTGVSVASSNKLEKAFLPIYIGVAFNQQALLHAQTYYSTHPLQYGKVSLDIFTNIAGKVIKPLKQYRANFDLGAIFFSWWNTGTYLFPFVQDFGTSAFFWVPFVIAAILTLAWKYWQSRPNFLSLNLYAYSMFFIVMSVYLSFTVRAEMYIDLFLLIVIYWFIKHKDEPT